MIGPRYSVLAMVWLACQMRELAASDVAPPGKGSAFLELTVRETAGLRRFGYPVHAKLHLGRAVTDRDRFRLVREGKPVAAQFRRLATAGDEKAVALDFEVNQDPLQKTTYKVEYGPDVKAGPEPNGLSVEETDAAITVRSGGMTYVVRRSLKGLLNEVRSGKTSYLRPGSAGLLLDGKPVLGDDRSRVEVVNKGPFAVVLAFSRLEYRANPTLPLSGRQGTAKPARKVSVTMTIPRSKSWVEAEVNVVVLDRDAQVTSLGASLNLEVEGAPTIVDFGAGSMVYTALGKDEAASLIARAKKQPPWEVRTGKLPKQAPFAMPAPAGSPAQAEGWAHLMDSKRCTALAIERFGRTESEDRILAESSGKLTWTRGVDRAASMRFWLHFVPMPVQVGAVTSPQSMMAPLQVDVK